MYFESIQQMKKHLGQLEYSLMPSRTAGSESTLIVSKGTPVSFRMPITWAENPH